MDRSGRRAARSGRSSQHCRASQFRARAALFRRSESIRSAQQRPVVHPRNCGPRKEPRPHVLRNRSDPIRATLNALQGESPFSPKILNSDIHEWNFEDLAQRCTSHPERSEGSQPINCVPFTSFEIRHSLRATFPSANITSATFSTTTEPIDQMLALLNELNPEQRQAVEALDDPVLILAGAGTGKTRAITYRIANLIARGLPAESILAVTFTNKAAEEMRNRVTDLLLRAGVRPGQPWVSTFHSLCARLLRREAA